jgi:hypothetical protein
MGFLDSLSKTLSSGVDRAKFEADKFQRTSRISGEINNVKSQIDTNMRQLGERALELYEGGTITAPEIASLAQIIAQLRDQQTVKEQELTEAQNETFEAWQATQPQQPSTPTAQNVPISSDENAIPAMSTPPAGTDVSGMPGAATSSPSFTGRSYNLPESTDLSGSGLPNSSSVGGQPVAGSTPYACPNCGYSVPNNAVFCPNCGTRVTHV